jgi:hypothetical protein
MVTSLAIGLSTGGSRIAMDAFFLGGTMIGRRLRRLRQLLDVGADAVGTASGMGL